MSSAAFSIPNGSQPKISVSRRGQSPTTATSAAANDAIQQILDARRRRHKYGQEPQLRESAVGQAINVVVAPIHESIRRLGLARWLFTTIVISAVGIVLTGAVAAKMLRSGPPCPVHRATGRLLIGKSIPVGAQIRLHPKAGSLPDSALPKAIAGRRPDSCSRCGLTTVRSRMIKFFIPPSMKITSRLPIVMATEYSPKVLGPICRAINALKASETTPT